LEKLDEMEDWVVFLEKQHVAVKNCPPHIFYLEGSGTAVGLAFTASPLFLTQSTSAHLDAMTQRHPS
jgi:hypothetical protein